MPTKYQVFVDNLSGVMWCPTLGGETVEECIDCILNGNLVPLPSQHWMYYIYVLHQEKVPYWGKKPDIYKIVKSVAGSECKKGGRSLDYALTIWEEDTWLFTDKVF